MFTIIALTILGAPILVQADGFHAFGLYAGCTTSNRLPADKVKYTKEKVVSPYVCAGYCSTMNASPWSYYRYLDQACYCSNTAVSGHDIQTAQNGKDYCQGYQLNVDITVGIYEFSDCFSGYKSGGAVSTTTQSDLLACLTHCASPTVAYIPVSGRCICPGAGQALTGNGGVKTCSGSTTYLYTHMTSTSRSRALIEGEVLV